MPMFRISPVRRWLMALGLVVAGAAFAPLLVFAAEPEPRFAGELIDGTRIAGTKLTAWHSTTSKPQLDGKQFENDTLLWLRDNGLPEPRPPLSYVEFFGGDRLPGNVVEYESPSWGALDRHPPCLKVSTELMWQHPEFPAVAPIRVTTPWLKRIV